MPNDLAKEVRANFKYREEGWGRMKVLAKIGSSEWKTNVVNLRKNMRKPLRRSMRRPLAYQNYSS
jgi:hypothetical protein